MGGILDQWSAMKQDIASTLYFPYGDEYAKTMSSLLNAFGQKQEIHQPDFYWFERDRMEVAFTVNNGPVNAASGLYTVTLPTSEVDPTTGYSWPTPTSVWEHAVSGAQFYIQSKPSANTLVLKPVLTTTAITMQTGDKFFYVKQTSPEGSGGPVAQYYFSTQRSVSVDIQRHAKRSTGSALFNQMWYTQLESGVQVPYSNSQDVIDLQRIHSISFVHSFLTGVTADNLSTSESFGSFDGLNTVTANRGVSENTGGSPDETDFYAIEAGLSQQDGAVRNYSVLMPGLVWAQIQQSMLEYLKQTNIDTTNQELRQAFFGDSMSTEAMRTTLDFKALTLNGKNFALTRLGLLDNPQTFNTTAQATNPWQNYAFFMPIGSDANDGNGNMGKYVRLVHKPSRFMRMAYTGFMSPNGNQTRTDELNIDILSEYAYAFICANKFGRFYKA